MSNFEISYTIDRRMEFDPDKYDLLLALDRAQELLKQGAAEVTITNSLIEDAEDA